MIKVEVRMFKSSVNNEISLRYVYYTDLKNPKRITSFSGPILLEFGGDEDDPSNRVFWGDILDELREALDKPVLLLNETITEDSSGE